LDILSVQATPISCDNDPSQVSYELSSSNGSQRSYIYDNQGLLIESESLLAGDYTLELIDEANCRDVGHFTVTVDHCEVYVPTILSFSAQSPNNRLVVYSESNAGSVIEVMEIFDRWGNLVYQVKDVEISSFNDWWDGHVHNREQAVGVYTYRMVVLFHNGHTRQQTGSITLID